MNGSNYDNIYKTEDYLMYCKSIESTLCVNGEDVIRHNHNISPRGLSITKELIILGGSDIQSNREKRKNSDGYVFIYNYSFKLLQTIKINKTQVQEIRRVDQKEQTLSNNI